MVDITPLISKGKHMIRAYGDGSITVRDNKYTGSIIIFPDEVFEWNINSIASLTLADFDIIIQRKDDVGVLLLGCGEKQQFLPAELESELKFYGIIVEVMDTGAACRTYNALMAEERLVATALIAI